MIQSPKLYVLTANCNQTEPKKNLSFGSEAVEAVEAVEKLFIFWLLIGTSPPRHSSNNIHIQANFGEKSGEIWPKMALILLWGL